MCMFSITPPLEMIHSFTDKYIFRYVDCCVRFEFVVRHLWFRLDLLVPTH